MSPPKSKKMRIDECINLVQEKMEKEGGKEKPETEVSDILSFFSFGPSDTRGGYTSEDRELRKERGDRLLQLFREQPSLSSTASARRIEKNYERAVIWDEITRKINTEFGPKLEVLTVDKVKKLLTYYKKKEEGNFDSLKTTASNSVKCEEQIENPIDSRPIGELLSLLTSASSEDGISSKISPSDPPSISQPQLDQPFLPVSSSIPTSTAITMSERIFILKKERHDCVVQLAEHYHQRMCFDNASRSAAVNAERHNMWIRITHQVNERYAKELGGLGVEQAKKLYSNCKRRRRIKNESTKQQTMAMTSSSSNSPSIKEEEEDEMDEMDEMEDYDGTTPPSDHNYSGPTMELLTRIDKFIKDQDKDAEICRLKTQLQEKDEKINQLSDRISEQSAQHKKQMLSFIDEVRQRVVDGTFQ